MSNQSLSFLDEKTLISEITHIGWWKVIQIERASLKAHQHQKSYEICYIHSGQVSWWAGDQVYDVHGNQLYMTWPGELHGGMDDLMQKCEIYWIQFNLEDNFPGLEKTELEMLRDAFDNISHRTCEASLKVKSFFEQILQEHLKPNEYSKVKVKSLAQQLIIEIIACFNAPASNKINRHHSTEVQRSLDFIHLHFCEDISIDEVSHESGIKNTQFRKRFRQEVGMSPLNYINRQRIKKAKELLVNTKKDISVIANLCGFQTSQYFATVFKKFTSLTPAEFRNK